MLCHPNCVRPGGGGGVGGRKNKWDDTRDQRLGSCNEAELGIVRLVFKSAQIEAKVTRGLVQLIVGDRSIAEECNRFNQFPVGIRRRGEIGGGTGVVIHID